MSTYEIEGQSFVSSRDIDKERRDVIESSLPALVMIYKLYVLDIRCSQLLSDIYYENHDIAIAMSPSHADPVLPWLGLFKYLNQCNCPGWRYLNIYIRVTALAGGI